VNPFEDFIILTTKKKNQTGRKKKNQTHDQRDPAVGLSGQWVGCEVSQSDDEILLARPSGDLAMTRSFLLPSFLFFLFSFLLHREVSSSAVWVSCGRV
jgi:hypothetical protein